MILPTIEEIKTAISNPEKLRIPQLTGFMPVPGLLGPKQYAGGFSVVFPFVSGNQKKALRVWHKEIANIRKRTEQIASTLSSLNLPYFVNYEYISNGIIINDHVSLDVVVMDWVEGETLKEYINSIITSNKTSEYKREELQKLAQSFFALFLDMHKEGLSHGDLQHGNIIVKDANNLILIDYDSLYVPSMGEKNEQITTGLSGYQHPLRYQSKYANEKNDYFSELIIIVSLIYLSENLNIWEENSLMDEDYSLIFTERDFQDFSNCKLYQNANEASPLLCDLLKEVCAALSASSIQDLSPIEEIAFRNGLDWDHTTKSIYCILCGHPFEEEDIYCTNCGSKRIK